VLDTKINGKKFAIFGGTTLALGVGAHLYQGEDWWFHDRGKFKIINDGWFDNYALGQDKIGHFLGTYFLASAFRYGLDYSNFSISKQYHYSTLFAILYELYIELNDGFSKSYGFSQSDFISDVAGASYNLLQYYIPYLNNFQPRFSYKWNKKIVGGPKQANIFDDYEYSKYWISIRMKNVLPYFLSQYWPKFLMISVGSGLINNPQTQREIVIALDVDANELPLNGNFGNAIKFILNHLHFPLPGIRIQPDKKFFWTTF
ncbi:MAG: YfiM family protein, partial [Melioribacteraceae bacterium]|nr:YfiM family protein [Melioribacteraceae bacterium]